MMELLLMLSWDVLMLGGLSFTLIRIVVVLSRLPTTLEFTMMSRYVCVCVVKSLYLHYYFFTVSFSNLRYLHLVQIHR